MVSEGESSNGGEGMTGNTGSRRSHVPCTWESERGKETRKLGNVLDP